MKDPLVAPGRDATAARLTFGFLSIPRLFPLPSRIWGTPIETAECGRIGQFELKILIPPSRMAPWDGLIYVDGAALWCDALGCNAARFLVLHARLDIILRAKSCAKDPDALLRARALFFQLQFSIAMQSEAQCIASESRAKPLIDFSVTDWSSGSVGHLRDGKE